MKAEKILYSLHILTSVAVFFFLLLHFLVMHTSFYFLYSIYPGDTVTYMVIVTFMLYHGLYGIRGIVLEKRKHTPKIDIIFLLMGVVLLVLLNGSVLNIW